ALGHYHNAVLHFTGLDQSSMNGMGGNAVALDASVKDSIQKELIATWSNMTACYLKQAKFEKVLQTASKILDKDPKHIKAIFRKGEALYMLGNLDRAHQTVLEAAKLAPQDRGIRELLDKVKGDIRALEEKSRQELKQNLKV
ncbi:hypothetical protein EDD86DRAFT_176418, partial [Gorgonomyces haynaldii]